MQAKFIDLNLCRLAVFKIVRSSMIRRLSDVSERNRSQEESIAEHPLSEHREADPGHEIIEEIKEEPEPLNQFGDLRGQDATVKS